MMRRQSLKIFGLLLTVVGITSLPSFALAQTPSEFKCGEFDNTDPRTATSIDPGNIKESVDHILSRFFTAGTLSQRLRCSPLIVNTRNAETGITSVSVYQVSINLVNFGVLIILLVIAFANILRIKLDTYAVKKSIPLLIFGVITANVGLPVIRTLVDFAGILTAAIIGNTSEAATLSGFMNKVISSIYQGGIEVIGNTLNQLSGGAGSGGWALALGLVGLGGFAIAAMGPFAVILIVGAIFLLVFPAIFFFLLGLLFVARIYFLTILAAVSPLAFATLGFEPLRGRVWGWWWSHFIKWTFMVPATFFLFWLGTRFYDATGGQMDIGTYIVMMFLLFYSIQVPLKMGGTVMNWWNSHLVKPIGNLMYKPFQAAGEYVAKAGPRDISRFASAVRIPGTRIPLNQVRYWKELMGKIEARNAEKEAESLAVKRGQAAGQLYSSVEMGKAIYSPRQYLRDRKQYNTEQLQTIEGRNKVTALAQQMLGRVQIAPTERWSDLDPERKATFEGEANRMRTSGDPEQIAAAMVAHGLVGSRSVDPKYEQALKDLETKQKIKTGRVITLANNLGLTATGVAYSYGGTDPYAETMKQIQRQMVSAVDAKEQERILSNMLEELKSVTNNLTELSEIEKNPNYEAWAVALLKNMNKFPAIKTGGAPLNKLRDSLGIASPQNVFGRSLSSSAALTRKMQQSAGPEIKIDLVHLTPLIERNGVDPANFTYLPPAEKAALMAAYSNIEELKNSLTYYLEEQFKRLHDEKKIDASQRDQLRQQIPTVIKSTVKGAMPSHASESTFPASLSKEQIELIKARLTSYQNVVDNLKTIDEDVARRIAKEQVIKIVQPKPKVVSQPAPKPAGAATVASGAASTAPPQGQGAPGTAVSPLPRATTPSVAGSVLNPGAQTLANPSNSSVAPPVSGPAATASQPLVAPANITPANLSGADLGGIDLSGSPDGSPDGGLVS